MATECARLIVEPAGCRPALAPAIAAFAAGREPAILDAAKPDRFSRFSVLACDPARVVEENSPGADVFRRLHESLGVPPAASLDVRPLPFAAGWIGFVSYEAGLFSQGAALPVRPHRRVPLARFGLYDSTAIYDHAEEEWYAAAVDWPGGMASPVGERLCRVRRLLRQASDRPATATSCCESSPPVAHWSQNDYLERFTRVQEYIAAGDAYQVNLAIQWTARTSARPSDVFLRLREISPAPYSAFLRWGDRAVISSSPELFLALDGRRVITRPIKGTRPRGEDAVVNESRRTDLASSEKEQAELAMIVDLLRNDLGRVCEYGSVRVVQPGEIEAHPTVFHRVATIEGMIRREHGWRDVLEAAFPGGSIAGAPKIRALQIIGELEPVPRGVYCGAIGWIGLDGNVQLNIAIRTMFQDGDRVEFHAGSGIVADSQGEEEYEEVLTKAAAMRRALQSTMPGRRAPRPLTVGQGTEAA